MQVAYSAIKWQLLQVDGRYNVREELTDGAGNVYDFDYMHDGGVDVNVHLANTVTVMNAQLALQASQGGA